MEGQWTEVLMEHEKVEKLETLSGSWALKADSQKLSWLEGPLQIHELKTGAGGGEERGTVEG